VAVGTVSMAYSTGRKSSQNKNRLFFIRLRNANLEPNAGLWKTCPKPYKRSNGKNNVVFPVLVPPTMSGTYKDRQNANIPALKVFALGLLRF
jgi:hypothetical protein